jgi:phytoene desaturase
VVYESSDCAGGKMKEFTKDGYRFDMGPSLFTMPELVKELFDLAGKNVNDYFQYQKLEETCRYFFDDGLVLNGFSDPKKFAKEAELKTSVKAKDVLAFFKKSKFIYDSTVFLFLKSSLHKLSTYFSLKVFLSMIKLPFMGVFLSMNDSNKIQLKDDKLVQIFNRFATYNGSNPFLAPAILNIIPHLEFSKGAFFPKKGMYSIARVLYELAVSLGVQFFFNQRVEQIIVNGSKVEGVIVANKRELADFVICNTDVYYVYKNLLKQETKAEKVLKQERSSSALIFYWAMDKKFDRLDLHNIMFSSDYRQEFSFLKEGSYVYDDPTVYINITSKMLDSDAPKDKENWFVMINVPSDFGQDWDQLIYKVRKNIIAKLNKILDEDLEPLIVFEKVLEPRLIQANTDSYKGSLYGTASNSRMSAFFRHPNFSNQFNNLYFCGGSVHPGGGIPLALCSAKIVDDLIPAA